ncbi:MAG TPA: WcaF family extracellular polysaccharide biosynthesis acetyltransferase [Candidatus Methylacidiphilales bacterium]
MRLDLYNNSDFRRGAGTFKEGLWILTKCLFFLPALPWPSGLRVFLLRIFGARLGVGVVIRSGVNISFPWRFEAGNHVWIGEDVTILSLAPVTLGSHVCISQKAFLCTGSHDWKAEAFTLQTRAITIEDQVWIAAQAFVGPGANVGRGSIVAAGTVLMKPIPPDSIAKGNPASVAAKAQA